MFVHGHGQKSEQKHRTKNFAKLRNHLPLLTMFSSSSSSSSSTVVVVVVAVAVAVVVAVAVAAAAAAAAAAAVVVYQVFLNSASIFPH